MREKPLFGINGTFLGAAVAHKWKTESEVVSHADILMSPLLCYNCIITKAFLK